ncbi:putative oxidoreductase [Labrenzia sp. EL_208]|uniref:aldo/keto reductase n=1 Tax=Roseibium album TaxID=311410 RepID=UPI000D556A5F|nr:aldo/keto reductase [Roseibium album]MBG6176161.1 putative oxidoreductase [Labrenzia sp. EL_132]MBG6210706.1 putative oxidoreductase [Labrenzia sp. EL_126]MBG6230776.1 putative oxidoreductase [Labrenzia sp. EL_208]
MQRVSLTESLEFSRLIYGMWRLGDDADTTPAYVERKIQLCLDQGITTFDQADIYGGYTAEAVLGGALKANPALRNKMEIVTKCDIVAPVGRHEQATVKYYDTSRQHIEKSVETSLSDMGIDTIDLLLIHRPDPLMDHHETGAVLDDLVKSGKVRNVGVSNFRPWDWDLLQSGMSNRLVTNQIEVSLAEISPFTNGDIAFHQRLGTNLMAWSPLGGGALISETGKLGAVMDDVAAGFNVDRSAVAIAFLLTHPATLLPVLGTNNPDRIAQISDALKVSLDRETWYRLYEAALGNEVP